MKKNLLIIIAIVVIISFSFMGCEGEIVSQNLNTEGEGPAPVLLRSAGDYVILAKSAVTTVPDSVITGDVGLSPAALSDAEGFSSTLHTADQITGVLHAADMVSPTSTNLTTAVENMITAYNDAAGRLAPDSLNLGAGEIGGTSLSPGLYKWTSSVTINSNVTIDGGVDDTWIFQVAGDLTIGSNFDVILTGGAQAKNIVWQVSGEVVMGTGAHFEGIVLTQSQISMNTLSTMNGRLLAQTLIALDEATVTEPAL